MEFCGHCSALIFTVRQPAYDSFRARKASHPLSEPIPILEFASICHIRTDSRSLRSRVIARWESIRSSCAQILRDRRCRSAIFPREKSRPEQSSRRTKDRRIFSVLDTKRSLRESKRPGTGDSARELRCFLDSDAQRPLYAATINRVGYRILFPASGLCRRSCGRKDWFARYFQWARAPGAPGLINTPPPKAVLRARVMRSAAVR